MKRALTQWKKHEAVQSIRRSRILLKNKFFDMRIQPKLHIYARILVVTPRKSGTAVLRNTFRRRVKALFYEQNFYQGAFDWIIFAKSDLAQLSFSELQELLLSAFQSLSVPS